MNAFLDLAEQQISSPRKARLRAAEKRRAAKQDDQDLQAIRWRRWRRERVEALLAGPHGEQARVLLEFLQTVTPTSAGELIAIARSWRTVDADARIEVLSLVDATIIELRERHGLPPFDDGLPDEPATVFQIVKELLT